MFSLWYFYESYPFIAKYLHRTSRLTRWIASSFFDTLNIQQIANRANVSSHTVYQVLSTIHHSSSNLGEAISIDEFKGNVGTEKYQTIVVDPVKHRVFDVLYSRKGTCLVDYFKSLDQSKRMKVQYFSCGLKINPPQHLTKNLFLLGITICTCHYKGG